MKINYNRETGKDCPRWLILGYVAIVGPSWTYNFPEVIVQEEHFQLRASRQLI